MEKRREIELRHPEDLRKGDIIRMRIPFEENTRDYYNGYSPEEIRGDYYKDQFGDTSKPRFIIVMGQEERNIIYLPLTSSYRSRLDDLHQYALEDNSMTWKKDPDMKSYVELDSLRAVYVNPKWTLSFIGHITENDMVNIQVKLGKRDIDLNSKCDQRAYVPIRKEESFLKNIENNGYVFQKEENNTKIYRNNEGRTITKQRWGLVKYHVPLTKEEVKQMIAETEQISHKEIPRTFTEAVENITKSVGQESGVTI